jgi:hypothetical protein
MAEMTIRRFGVISLAKMYGLLMFIFGLIIGIIYGLIIIGFGATIAAAGGGDAAMGGVGSAAVGIGFMIGIPILYGILGFVMGAIGALIYNALSGIIGGVKFDLEGVQQEYAPPPPPHHWEPHQYPAQ